MLCIDDIHAFWRDLGSNPSVKKVKISFYRTFTKIDKLLSKLVDFYFFTITSSLLPLHSYLFTFHSSLTKLVD